MSVWEITHHYHLTEIQWCFCNFLHID